MPPDQKPGEGASPSALSACTAATIAGTYRRLRPDRLRAGRNGAGVLLWRQLRKEAASRARQGRSEPHRRMEIPERAKRSCRVRPDRKLRADCMGAGAMRQTRQTNPGRWQGGNNCWEPRPIVREVTCSGYDRRSFETACGAAARPSPTHDGDRAATALPSEALALASASSSVPCSGPPRRGPRRRTRALRKSPTSEGFKKKEGTLYRTYLQTANVDNGSFCEVTIASTC